MNTEQLHMLSPYVSPDDVALDKNTFLQTVADRIADDLRAEAPAPAGGEREAIWDAISKSEVDFFATLKRNAEHVSNLRSLKRNQDANGICTAALDVAIHAIASPIVSPKGLELPRMLVLSTAHIQGSTANALDRAGHPKETGGVPERQLPLHFPKGDYGWVIPLIQLEPGDELDRARWACRPDLLAIRQLAEAQGATWIMLDRDANVVASLPTYDY